MTAFGGLIQPLNSWANGNLNQIFPFGSFAKGHRCRRHHRHQHLRLAEEHDAAHSLAHGCFEFDSEKKAVKTCPAERALSAFLSRFLARLQAPGTVAAIDYDVYGRLLNE